MPKPFMDDDFMLSSDSAVILYHQYAKAMPIYDYHCHLSPSEILENRRFRNITELWLGGDHYKWRALRARGIDEKLITGDGGDKQKFEAWAKTMPYCIGNPLYHWTHLELQRYFDFHEPLGEDNWERAWEHCNRLIAREDFNVRNLIKRSNVKVICTTDDPADSLDIHRQIARLPDFGAAVLPAFRPDKAIEIARPSFSSYVDRLAQTGRVKIDSFGDLLQVLENRAKTFHEAGCRLSDHGIETVVYEPCTLDEASAIFRKTRQGEAVSPAEERMYKTHMLLFLGKLYARLGWTMQLHLGAIRNNNSKMYEKLGPDTGYDSVGEFSLAQPLNAYMDALDRESALPQTILYNLNATQNDVFASTAGNFQSGGVKGKIQFGSGWWFNDTRHGMINQMTSLANLGLLSGFVGMLTDSRSFLSYPRHEYFRRILCDLIGGWVEAGELPDDYLLLGKIVQDISFNNARDYFGIEVPD